MKAAPFTYLRAVSVAEACTVMAGDAAARIVAGGQTLVPMMAMRLARPSVLIDIAHVEGLSGLVRDDGQILIGAMTRQAAVERSSLIARDLPLLAAAIVHVGHPPTRSRGTVGGSICNADPSAEIPLVAVTLGATLRITTPDGEEETPADGFFIGPMLTVMPDGGCLTRISFPVWTDARVGAAVHEISARRSDYAYAAAAAQIALDENGICTRAALGFGGVGDMPVAMDASPLVGRRLSLAGVRDVVCAAANDLDAVDDLHASAAYRRRAAASLGVRAVTEAVAKAGGALS
jgi:CO/xanthine dehydrogenase FAD-binding subunit